MGLTMAGAVSAGCYTAGVLDYLFEILDLWERAKKGEAEGINEKLISLLIKRLEDGFEGLRASRGVGKDRLNYGEGENI